MRLYTRTKIWLTVLILMILFSITAHAASPGLTKVFVPVAIGPGSVSTLTFVITNNNAVPITNVAFTDTLPAGVTIADPAMITVSCHPTPETVLTAPPGGSTITLSGLDMAANGTCTISVDVTSDAVGSHVNTTSSISADGEPEGPGASATLTVDLSRPGFSKIFSPASVDIGTKSTLTFTIDNSSGNTMIAFMSFTDNFPDGMEIADPANVSAIGFFSPGTVTAAPGSQEITLSGSTLDIGQTGTISVDVITSSGGTFDNSSGNLNYLFGQSGKANASLEVTVPQVSFYKSFINDPTPPGGSTILEFTLVNRSQTETITDITFTDDLDATLSGLTAIGLPASNICGPVSTLSGTSIITLTGGSLGPEESATFRVTLQIPSGAAPGSYPGTTGILAYNIAGVPSVEDPATDILDVWYTPAFIKTFLSDPVTAGETVVLEFTITNTHPTDSATKIAFTDNIGSFIPWISHYSLPDPGFCGPGSTMTHSTFFFLESISMSGGSLAEAALEVITDEIPTLSEWGMIILAILMGIFSIIYIRRHSEKIFFNL